jgi:hypothetical protein
MVRGFRRGSREDEAALEKRRFENRCLSVFPDEDGMYVVQGRLPAEVGALLMRAVEAAGDALYREEGAPEPVADTHKAAARRRADALAEPVGEKVAKAAQRPGSILTPSPSAAPGPSGIR